VYCTVEERTDAIFSTLQTFSTADDFPVREKSALFALVEVIYQFLLHTVDLKRGKLIDKLVTRRVISPGEGTRIRNRKTPDAQVNNLMKKLRNKSAAEFESFLATLSETGQQSVADVVRRALQTAGQTGHCFLRQHLYGEQGC